MSDQEEREALADSVKTAERLEAESRRQIPVSEVTLPESNYYTDKRCGVVIGKGISAVEFFQDTWVFACGDRQGMVVPGAHDHYNDAARRAWEMRKQEDRREDYIKQVRKREEMAEKAKQPAEVVKRMKLDATEKAKDLLKDAGFPESFRVDVPFLGGTSTQRLFYVLRPERGEA